LLHKREEIGHAPVLGDLAVAHAHHVHGLELDFATGWRHAEKLAHVRAVVVLVGRYPVPIGKLPVDVRVEVREGSAQNLVTARRRYSAATARPPRYTAAAPTMLINSFASFPHPKAQKARIVPIDAYVLEVPGIGASSS